MGTGAGDYGMKEKDIVDGVEPVACLTLRREEKIVKTILLKAKATFCSI